MMVDGMISARSAVGRKQRSADCGVWKQGLHGVYVCRRFLRRLVGSLSPRRHATGPRPQAAGVCDF